MAQTKFKLHTEAEETVTHAHAQNEKIEEVVESETTKNKVKSNITPEPANGSLISSSVNLGIHLIKLFEILTPTQKQQLINYAQKDDKTASCVIKELLIEKGIIQ